MTHRLLLASIVLIASQLGQAASPDQLRQDFMAMMVAKHGFEPAELKRILWQARTQKSILEAIARPAERIKPWWEYRKGFLTKARIKGGLAFWRDNQEILRRAEQKYGVPPEVIVGILGVETNYGTYPLRHSVLDALHTLGFHYPKRGKFFRSELKHFLLLAREEGLDPTQVKGSYAGAMGKPQFMPSSYRRLAIDFDGNGTRDIWHNNVDVIGSIAYYLSRNGWQGGEPIAVRIANIQPQHEEFVDARLRLPHTVAELRRAGIGLPSHWKDPAKVSLIKLQGRDETQYWARLQNFRSILSYNPRNKYAMAVYQLGDAIKRVRQQQARNDR